MESIVPCVTVHTGLRQGQGPGPSVPYYANPVPCTGPGPGPGPISVQCDYSVKPNSFLSLSVHQVGT